LFNDATGLLALEFGIAIVVRGATPTFTEGAFRFLYLIVGGLAVGLLIGWVADWIERRVDDAPIEIALRSSFRMSPTSPRNTYAPLVFCGG
jgi:CPA1 family monovalent cation:H+ antiporter